MLFQDKDSSEGPVNTGLSGKNSAVLGVGGALVLRPHLDMILKRRKRVELHFQHLLREKGLLSGYTKQIHRGHR